MALTDDKQLPGAERKRLQIEHMRGAAREVRLIKLADHCSNIASLPADWPRERKREYLDWSEQVARACAGVRPRSEHEHAARLERAADGDMTGEHRGAGRGGTSTTMR